MMTARYLDLLTWLWQHRLPVIAAAALIDTLTLTLIIRHRRKDQHP